MREYRKKNRKLKKNKNVEKALQILIEDAMKGLPDENDIKNTIGASEKIELSSYIQKISLKAHIAKIRKAAVCFFIAFFTSAITVYAVWRVYLVQTKFTRNTDVFVEEHSELEYIQEIYAPMYLPQGYVLQERMGEANDTDFVISVFGNEKYQITIRQQI